VISGGSSCKVSGSSDSVDGGDEDIILSGNKAGLDA